MKLLTICVVLTLGLNVVAKDNNYISGNSDSSGNSDKSGSSESCESSGDCFEKQASYKALTPVLSSPEECARECHTGEKPKTCYYKFTVEYYATLTDACNPDGGCLSNKTTRLIDDCQCILADGFERGGLITVNRMLPGPSIIACKFDNIVVDVENHVAGNAITIHWHGIYQKGYQYADGIPYVTQCPIVEDTSFRYQWRANNAGTHFWHAHSGLHKSEGLMGALIIREPKIAEPNNNLWESESIDHIIYVEDWFHDSATDHFPGTLIRNPRQLPANFLINGMGEWTGFNVENGIVLTGPPTLLATFIVKQGVRYRFRLINACGLACPVTMTIQGHNITIIAIDGEPVVPVTVDSLTSSSAERFDFVLNADKPIGTYWMQFRGVGECVELQRQQVAFLRYESAAIMMPQLEKPSYEVGLKKGTILNEINVHCDGVANVPNVICLSQLKNARKVPRKIMKPQPDVRMYIGFAFMDLSRESVFRPGTYKTFLVAINETVAYVGNITNVFPPSPLLSQRRDIPDEQICSVKNLPASCKGPEPCPCTHVESIPLNSVVELVLVDENAITNLSHPFHLHGHPFYIVAEGSTAKYNISKFTLPVIKDLDDRGLIKRQLRDPPSKDTYAIPNTGFTIIRFLADNPGYWLFHCHFEFHLAVGMVTTFHIGTPDDLDPPPKGFPKCGNFLSPIRDDFY